MAKFTKKKLDQFAVIGLGRFGSELARALVAGGKEVLAIDESEERTQAVSGFATHAITADATDESVLKAVEIGSFDAVVVAIGDIQASILTTLTCKEMGVPYIIAKAYNEKHKKVLEKIGADYVLIPESDMAYKTANKLINQRLNDLMEVNERYSIIEIAVPAAWSGKSLIELDVRKHFKVNIILVLEKGEEVLSSPGGDTVLSSDDHIIVGGNNDDIAKFSKYLNKLK